MTSGELRVLMVSDVSPSRPLGGGERMLWEQARCLAARGHDVRVVSRADSDATAAVSGEHERVIAAILDGSPQAASASMRDHIESVYNAYTANRAI